jgi:CheY-like chemotaxis protein/two-component sensor histidine kinase
MTHPSFKPSSDPPPPRSEMTESTGAPGFATERQLDALGRVASVVAHELTNLIQILSSSLDRLTISDDAPGVATKTVRAAIDRGTRLARQLQTFAQTAPPRLQAREIHQLIAAWMPDFEEAIGPDRRLELRLRYSGTIVVDADQLQTALVNLLTNAREATESGTAIILELSRFDRGGVAGVRLAVIDHGEGMTDDVARQAVAPFFTTRPPGKGMGLGLTIARMVAEAHGGSLEIDSAFGRGTTVSIHLATAEARAGDRGHERAGAAAQTAAVSAPASPAPPTTSPAQTSPTSVPPGPTPPTYVPPYATPSQGVPPSAGRQEPRASDPWTGEPRTAPAAPPAPPVTQTRPPANSHAAQVPAAPQGPPQGPPQAPSPHGTPVYGASAGVPVPTGAAPRRPNILVIDDEEAIAEYFRIILSAERYDVSVVTSAHQALDRFAEDPSRYDTVLLDMMLRDGSGIDIYRKFRQLRPDLPVVVCTGFSDNESLAPIRADGHDILFKPCPRGDVLKAVARAVARSTRK